MRGYRRTILTAAWLAGCGSGAGEPPPPPADSPFVTSVQSVQGTAAVSPLAGRAVRIEGVVTGDFQSDDAIDGNDLGGFYVQAAPDGDAATSDGVFVFEGRESSVDVAAGDTVSVAGTVTEFFGETQIVASAVAVTGRGTARATSVRLPAESVAIDSDGRAIPDLERFEGMLIVIDETLTVSDLRGLERYGEVALAAGGRPYQFTNGHAPDVAGYVRHREELASRRIVLDDGRNALAVQPIRYLPAGSAQPIRIGDRVAGLTGNLRYSRGAGESGREGWRIEPVDEPRFRRSNPRPEAPDVEGGLRVATLNVLNWFATIDTGVASCGPSGDSGCRGADSVRERGRQLAKIVNAIRAIDADISGLVELENDASASMQMIVDALNAAAGRDEYAFVDTGAVGDDAIRTGFLYKPAKVAQRGRHAVLDAGVDPRFDDSRNRPAIAQTFEQQADGARLTLVLNHLKSKGSDCDDAGDPDTGDGQGNCNGTRTEAAKAIVDWIATDPTGSGDPDFLVLGDLNAYPREDPLAVFAAAGFVDVVARHAGDPRYTYVFDGQSGALDYALATPGLARQVRDAADWHINADEAPALDYDLDAGRHEALFDAATPFRASDHDPVVVGIDLIG